MNETTRPVARIRGPGHREITWAGHVFNVYQFASEWGDKQWMVDRDDKPAWSQCDTLTQARETIRKHGADEKD